MDEDIYGLGDEGAAQLAQEPPEHDEAGVRYDRQPRYEEPPGSFDISDLGAAPQPPPEQPRFDRPGWNQQIRQVQGSPLTDEFTQADEIALQRMRNLVPKVQGDPLLSAREKSDYMDQITQAMNPLAQRKMAAEARKEQQA